MALELPTFAEMKGVAVSFMNHSAKNKDIPDEFPVQFPVEYVKLHGYPALVVNGTSVIIWKQGIPKDFLREGDAMKIFDENHWAYVSVHIVAEKRRLPLQKLMFPQFAPYVHVIEVFEDWNEALGNAVLQASAHAFTQKVVSKSED